MNLRGHGWSSFNWCKQLRPWFSSAHFTDFRTVAFYRGDSVKKSTINPLDDFFQSVGAGCVERCSGD